MEYRVSVASDAAKYWEKLDKPNRQRVAEKIRAIQKDCFDPQHSKTLSNREERSGRVGAYRILFFIDHDAKEIVISRIGPRGDIYR